MEHLFGPLGNLIAFTKMRKGRFYIGVMRVDGTGERLLTENYYKKHHLGLQMEGF